MQNVSYYYNIIGEILCGGMQNVSYYVLRKVLRGSMQNVSCVCRGNLHGGTHRYGELCIVSTQPGHAL
jgi:hypothetical protein